MDKNRLEDILQGKRNTSEAHIQLLQKEGRQGVRYTIMLPNVLILAFGLLGDVGWILHLIARTIYFCRNGLNHALDYIALVVLVATMFGVVYIIYLDKIHEKDIATRFQKNLSFGLTIYAGLVGAIVGILQMVLYKDSPSLLVLTVIGGLLVFVSGLPIYLSFRKGIFYGVQ
jgi:hypothetical protein